MKHSRQPRVCGVRCQSGVGLIEVLVAVLILGVGLLGLAALQMSALKRSQSGLERSQAVIQTSSILDAMRANRTMALAGKYDVPIATGCTIPQDSAAEGLARRDIEKWRGELKALLGPAACGGISVITDGTAQVVQITVQWNDQRAGGKEAENMVSRTVL